MSLDKRDFLDGYEKRVVNGVPSSKSDKALESAILKNAVISALNAQKDGNTVLEDLIQKRIEHELECPREIDLAKWQKVLGEDINKSEVKVRGADELFGDIVIKD